MALPDPEPGLVIHYHCLWEHEAAAGRENARYPRPCTIAVVAKRPTPNGPAVLVCPITHSPPGSGTPAIEIPLAVKKSLGLDDQRSWLILNETNAFVWPGHDLDYNRQAKIVYGAIPGPLFARIKASLLEQVRAGRLLRITR